MPEVLEENSCPHAPSQAKAVKVKSGLGSGFCNDLMLAAPPYSEHLIAHTHTHRQEHSHITHGCTLL